MTRKRTRRIWIAAAVLALMGVAGQHLNPAQAGPHVPRPAAMKPAPLCYSCKPLPAVHAASHGGSGLLGGYIAYRILRHLIPYRIRHPFRRAFYRRTVITRVRT